MAKILIFDTDILIDYLLGIEDAKNFFTSFTKSDRYTTAISIMEIYRGAQNKQELTLFKKFFLTNFTEIIQINENASNKAIELVETIALLNGGKIIKGNIKHYEYIPWS